MTTTNRCGDEDQQQQQEQQKQSKEEMSTGERLSWLRERGVQVVTPEERRIGRVASAIREAEKEVGKATTTTTTKGTTTSTAAATINYNDETKNDIDNDDDVVSFVLVPWDTSKPLEEHTFNVSLLDEDKKNKRNSNICNDLLVNHLKYVGAFGGRGGKKDSNKDIDVNLLRQRADRTYMVGGSGGNGNVTASEMVSDDTLRRVAASESHVETFSLVNATKSNDMTAVNVYLDEVGMLKRLPLNSRASQYATLAGYDPAPQFYGDVYLGRIRRGKNASLRLGRDTSMDATWLRAAAMQNLEHQMDMNRITGDSARRQPPVAGQDGVPKKENDGPGRSGVSYSWTQTEEELEIVVLVPQGTKSKDVKAQFRSQSMSMTLRNDRSSSLSIRLFERVDADACTWTLEKTSDNDGSSRKLVITMEKVETAFWPRIQE